MTVICGGGPSEAKPGTPAAVALAGTALEILITRRLPWIAPFITFLSPFVFESEAFCESDPPDMPEWTAADVGGVLVGQSSEKLAQTIRHVAWYAFCQCASPVTTPVPPVVNPPANLPVLQPNPLGACDTATYAEIPETVTGGSHNFQGSFAIGNTLHGIRMLPVGATHVEVTVTQTVQSGLPQSFVVEMATAQAEGGVATPLLSGSAVYSASNPTTNRYTASIPTGAVGWWGRIYVDGGVWHAPIRFSVTVTVHCGGPPNSLQPACCPPDPTLSAKLDSLLALVTEIQRQGVPFAYVPGLEYAGLSGSGHVDFSDPILRAQVELTTVPPWLANVDAEPDRIFDVGWLAIGSADGYEPTQRITHTPFMVRVPGDATRIGYSFGPGIVATIRTFSREP